MRQVASTVALCGEREVQTDTARVFLKLLKSGDVLSEAQLLVRSRPMGLSRVR